MTMKLLKIEDLPDPGDRFALEECIGSGVFGKVLKASDGESDGRKVAVKIQTLNADISSYILEEYKILSELSNHSNITDFYGAYKKSQNGVEEIWFAMELCDGGSILDLVKSMQAKNRTMSECHIAFVLKEVVKAVIYLHEHHVMHRDIRCSNILLTKEGEVKLIDFGLCKHLTGTLGKTKSILGSPCWMPPEAVDSNYVEDGYGNRADVWALGITAIEMADGKAPFQEMHPTRAIFQIVRNPPPTLYRPSNWSDDFNDFINECLVKNPEHRPFMVEVIEHPFLEQVPENNYYLCQEIKSLNKKFSEDRQQEEQHEEVVVSSNLLLRSASDPEQMHMEDLAAIENLTEDTIIDELQARMTLGQFHTFVGDVLLILNPNEHHEIYDNKHHRRYKFKSRSDNKPHIFAVADGAYQDALHHMTPQNIIITGESGSGKTTNFIHVIDHLLYLGENNNINSKRIKKAVKLLQAFTQASTPVNKHSSRCVMKVDITFGRTGKTTGAIFTVNQIEKWRVSSTEMSHGNFDALNSFFDGMAVSGQFDKYYLTKGRKYRYLRVNSDSNLDENYTPSEENISKYEEILDTLKEYDFSEEEIDVIHEVISAILILGDVKFKEDEEGNAIIDNEEFAVRVANLLKIDEKKFCWALTNYCLIQQSVAMKKKHTSDEARDARDVLANTLYIRLLDYIVKTINHKLSYGMTIFGQQYSVNVLDMFGFECFRENHLPQLLINTLNEQLHYHYLQRIFAWEAMELEEEDVTFEVINYYNNKATLDEILSKPEGLLSLIDHASKMGHGGQYITDYLGKQEKDRIKSKENLKFSIGHYTGRVIYSARELADRNRDFLPPEVIEVMRLSSNKTIKTLFSNKLSKTGNLSMSFDEMDTKPKKKYKFGQSPEIENKGIEEYSQIKKMRTAISVFKSLSLDILKELSVGGSSGGTHFVKCIRSDLQNEPKGFHPEVVKQQIRAMAILETAKARQKGYPSRTSFSEFLRRYQFLAFDFNETVDVTKENCRLLLIRLQMEGWLIGTNKVLLKYYNEEYLARLYETQVKKVIKIQSMIRAFVARRKISKRIKEEKERVLSVLMDGPEDLIQEKAAVIIQKAYRGMAVRKKYGPLINKEKGTLNEETAEFIRAYAMKWKNKSVFQVLLQYRAAKYQDLFNFSQQVHLYNQNAVHTLHLFNTDINLKLVDDKAKVSSWLGEVKPTVLKVPFRLDEIPYYDTTYLCVTDISSLDDVDEPWDAPFRRRNSQTTKDSKTETNIKLRNQTLHKQLDNKLSDMLYTRDPDDEIKTLPAIVEPKIISKSPAKSPIQVLPTSPLKPIPETKIPYSSEFTDRTNISTTKPANKDFEFIKPSPAKQRPPGPVNPITELQKLGRRGSGVAEDEAPFNFQGMLRKTNFARGSLKRTVENMGSIKNKHNLIEEVPEQTIIYSRTNLKKVSSLDLNERKFAGEIAPGIYLEGICVDL